MEKITSRAALQLHIQYLEVKQSEEWAILKSSIVTAREELRPLNMIKRTLKEMNSSSTDKNELIFLFRLLRRIESATTVVGVTAGIWSKTVLFGFSQTPIKKVVGLLFQFKVANIVAKQAENIKSVGSSLIDYLRKTKSITSNREKNG